MSLRYKEDGETHLDFHGATNTTIEYIIKNFGEEALHKIMFKVGYDVYEDIRQKLSEGDFGDLVQHWEHFFNRENGTYDIDIQKDKVTLTVHQCPAVKHVQKLGLKLSPHFCSQTKELNRGLCQDTGFTIETKLTGTGSCQQILRKKNDTK